MPDQQTTEPNWGAVGEQFPLWQAKETLSQIEKRIASQTTTLGIYETRATTLLGWLSAEIIATVTASISSLLKPPAPVMDAKVTLILASSVLVPAVISAYFLAKVFAEKVWSVGGVDINWLASTSHQDPSELEILQEFSREGRAGVRLNDAYLAIAYKWLTRGWKMFLVVPASALVVSLFLVLVLAK